MIHNKKVDSKEAESIRTEPIESAESFIERTKLKRIGSINNIPDISRNGMRSYKIEAITYHIEGTGNSFIDIIERSTLVSVSGTFVHKQIIGETNIRIGYYAVGQVGSKKGQWIWGQYSLMTSEKDILMLVQKAIKEGTIRE